MGTKASIQRVQCLIAVMISLVGIQPAIANQNPPRPNIALILCDDLGYADVGYNAAHFGVQTNVVTPNIDALASRGTIFTQAYVAHPFCGPSRMALLSGGIRVPMFMHWPGHIPSARTFDHPILALDLYPTLAGLAGAKIPVGKELDGRNIWEDILRERNPHLDESIFWLSHHGVGNEVAIRHGNLKAYRKNFGKWQVFDLAEDVSESTDIASSNKAFLSRRITEATAWSKTLNEPQWHDTEGSLQSWAEN